MLKNNYHTHTKYCGHATGDVIDYVKEAYDLGFVELGMTDHAPIPEYFMDGAFYKQTYSYQNMKLDMVDEYEAKRTVNQNGETIVLTFKFYEQIQVPNDFVSLYGSELSDMICFK